MDEAASDKTPGRPLSDPADFLKLGLDLAGGKGRALAIALADKAAAEHPDDPLWQALANVVLRRDVPSFHGGMLHDHRRNGAYRAAIERFAPGRTVLDIGTGSGLLAMMAARAGAERVYACEEDSMLAASARKIIAANGLSDRIKVFDCHSGRLDRMRDLDGGVDLVVSEVFADQVLDEGVLGALAHARAHLTRPGAIFLPERASAMVALADFPPGPAPVGMVEGFDLSGFNVHLNPRPALRADDPGLVLRSEAACLFDFDFAAGDPPQCAANTVELVSTGGMVSGLAQWLHLRFADDITYENRPGSGPDLHWIINLATTMPRLAEAGARYTAGGFYRNTKLVIWCRSSAG